MTPDPVTIERWLTAAEQMKHREHQLAGVLKLIEHPVFALFDEVGAGKTKQCVDAAQILYLQGDIDTVVVFTPGYARSTWADADPMLGEVAKHAWTSVPNVVHEWHGKYTDLDLSAKALHFIVTNYEFVRREERRDDLIRQLKGRRTWVIADESWCIKGPSQQMKAVKMIRRKRAERATVLNGTPLSDGKPIDLYHQFEFLDPAIIGAPTKTAFRAHYCIMGGFQGKSIVDYQHLDELNARVAPYVLTRRTRDCFDLPPMLPPITVEAQLSQENWKLYQSQRDDMVTWLDGQVSVSRQAIVKILRLSQITSGYLGGLETVQDDDFQLKTPQATVPPLPAWLQRRLGHEQTQTVQAEAPTQASKDLPERHRHPALVGAGAAEPVDPTVGSQRVTREIGREKLDALLGWLAQYPVDQLLVWCRFRAELERTTNDLRKLYPVVENLKGGQSPADREAAKRLLAPGKKRRGAVVGNQKAGGASLNFSGANVMVFLSNGPALIERTQSIGRIERPGATQPMLIVDVVAVGPKGQKTIDHKILKALRAKEDMSRWTINEWRKLIAEGD